MAGEVVGAAEVAGAASVSVTSVVAPPASVPGAGAWAPEQPAATIAIAASTEAGAVSRENRIGWERRDGRVGAGMGGSLIVDGTSAHSLCCDYRRKCGTGYTRRVSSG